MKLLTTFSLAVALALFGGCGSDDDDNGSVAASVTAGVYEGYAQDDSGSPLFLRAFIINESETLLQVLDDNDAQSTVSGSQENGTVTFDGMTCKMSGSALLCEDYSLETVAPGTFDVSAAEGTYKAVDGNREGWTMTIAGDGTLHAAPDADGSTCEISGTLSSEVSDSVATLRWTATGCENDGESFGVMSTEDLYDTADALNVMAGAGILETYWFKQ